MARAELHCGDCRDVLPTLPDASADAVVTDPPYGQTNEAYDSPIAFDPALWRECYRVAKPDAALISFAGSPTYHRLASAVEAGGWKVRQMWGWVYRDGLITSAWPKEGFDRLRPAFDPIVFATKGKVFLNVEREGEAWDRLTGRDPGRKSYRMHGLSGRNGEPKTRTAAGHYPTNLTADDIPGFEYFVLSRTNPALISERTGHPNQKPLALMRWLVSKLPGGTAMDIFMGSGSTGVACVELGLDFIGVESDPAYYELARCRIEAADARYPLFGGA